MTVEGTVLSSKGLQRVRVVDNDLTKTHAFDVYDGLMVWRGLV
jgi:hypothetical protein